MFAQGTIDRTMTEEEFVDWCDADTRAEYVDGEVIVMSPESGVSEDSRWFVGVILRTYVEAKNLGLMRGPNFQVRLRRGLRRVPELLFISNERLGIVQPNHLEGAPDLAMEIVSPDSVERDWREKYSEYQASGVREYWVIDPQNQRVEVYGLAASGEYQHIALEDGAFHSQVVPGFWLRPEWLWQRPLPSALDVLRVIGVLRSPE